MIPFPRLFMVGLRLSAALLISAPAFAASTPPPAEAASARAADPAPRVELSLNTGAVYADTVLREDTVWRGELLVEGTVTVAPQATLTVEPGTVVRFRQREGHTAALVVQGRLVVTGSRETPVLFGSGFATAAPGDWQGIMLLGTEKKNVLENCRIEGAQTGLDALFSSVTLSNLRSEHSATGLRFQDTLVFMEEGGASECDTGLSLSDSEATLRSIGVVGNRVGISAKHSSVYLDEGNLSGNQAAAFSGDGCRLKIQGGALQGNGSALTLLGSEGSVSGVKLVRNREYGISLTGSRVRVSGNVISGNGDNGMMVFDGAGAAWGNSIYDNAGYDLYNAGSEEFRAPGNWWGTGTPKVFEHGGRGKVLYAPVLTAPPAQ